MAYLSLFVDLRLVRYCTLTYASSVLYVDLRLVAAGALGSLKCAAVWRATSCPADSRLHVGVAAAARGLLHGVPRGADITVTTSQVVSLRLGIVRACDGAHGI